MPNYHGYLIKRAYPGYDPQDYSRRDWEHTLIQLQMQEMEERAAAEKRRRIEANKLLLRTNPAMRQAIEEEVSTLRETKGRGRIRRIFSQSQENPWSAAIGPAIGGGIMGGMAGAVPGALLMPRYGGKALAGALGLGAGLGALGGGAIGYGRPQRQLAKLKGIGEGLEGFQSYHEQLPEEGLDEGYRYGPFSEAHQELARKLIGQSAAG
jgi:hypothetical protein